MPLKNSSSDKARSENLGKEIAAGKDPKQAAAIAYAVQRRAKAKGYADGGMADGDWAGLNNDQSAEPGAQSTDQLQADYAPAGKSARSRVGAALSSLGKHSAPDSVAPVVNIPNVLAQPQQYSRGGEVGVQVGQPELVQGQLGNEMRLPEMPITVEGDQTRFARLRNEDRPVQHDEYGNALAAGLVGGVGSALRGGARALGSAFGQQVADPDKTAQIAIPPLRQLQYEAAQRLAAKRAAQAAAPGGVYVPRGYAEGGEVEGMPEEPSHKLPGQGHHKLPEEPSHKVPEEPSHPGNEEPSHYARGGMVAPVPHHESSSLRWPLAHLSERGRRQQSYQLGMHLQHHFSDGGVAGNADVSRIRAKYGIGEHYGTKDEAATIAASAHNKSAAPTPAEVERVATNYGQRVPEAPEALRDPNAAPGARTWDEYKATHPHLMQEDTSQPPGVVVPEAQFGDRPIMRRAAQPRITMEHNPNAVGLDVAGPHTDYTASREAAQQAKIDAAPVKQAGLTSPTPPKGHEMGHYTAPAAQPTAPQSPEERIEAERQAERQAVLHPSVLESIRRHLKNGLMAFGHLPTTDFEAEDRQRAKEANENAIQQLNVLHGNKEFAHKEAKQTAESPQSQAYKYSVSKTLDIPMEAIDGLSEEQLSGLAKEVSVAKATGNSARIKELGLQLRAQAEANTARHQSVQERQQAEQLRIAQQNADTAQARGRSTIEGQQARILANPSKAILTATADQRKNIAQLDKVEENLDRLRKPGVPVTNVDVAAIGNDLASLMRNAGAPTEAELAQILPKSLQSRSAAIWQFITGQSQDTGLKGLTLEQYGALAGSIKAALNRAYSRNVNMALQGYKHLEAAHPEAFQEWRNQAAQGLPLSTYGEGSEAGPSPESAEPYRSNPDGMDIVIPD